MLRTIGEAAVAGIFQLSVEEHRLALSAIVQSVAERVTVAGGVVQVGGLVSPLMHCPEPFVVHVGGLTAPLAQVGEAVDNA